MKCNIAYKSLNLSLLYTATPSQDTRKTITLEETAARTFARGSATVSALLSGLIVLQVSADAVAYRSYIPLALAYAFAYAITAYWTWRFSRVAAISALLLYLPMRHSNCGLHVAVQLSICMVYVIGIVSTMLIHKRTVRRNASNTLQF